MQGVPEGVNRLGGEGGEKTATTQRGKETFTRFPQPRRTCADVHLPIFRCLMMASAVAFGVNVLLLMIVPKDGK